MRVLVSGCNPRAIVPWISLPQFICADPEGCRGSGPIMESHKDICFLRSTGKSCNYPTIIQCRAITGTLSKRHLNDVSLAGLWWPAFNRLLGIHFLSNTGMDHSLLCKMS